jgi:arabinogalactan endo-1,4-beta-galactosidase
MRKTPSGRLQTSLNTTLLLAVGVAAFWQSSRAADSNSADGPAGSRLGADKPMPAFMVGADISAVQQAEDRGTHFTDGGVQKDVLQILKDHGFNYIRLRIFVDPTKSTPRYRAYSAQGYCDLAHTIVMAKRVKQAGMGLLIDFHYSDSWADPGKQYTPAAWADLPFPELVKTMHDWTHDAVQKLKDAGAEPDMVQVGNEITPGMMVDRGGSTKNWDQLSQLLKAGIAGVEEVDPRIIIMLHLDRGGDNKTTRRWVDNALAHGVQFDVLGESCYTQYQGPAAQWKANIDDLAARYPNLHFVIAELADQVRPANDIMHDLPDHKGLGTFIWEPTRNGNGQGLFTSSFRTGRRTGGPTTTAPATPPREGAVIPEKMGVYDQLVKDYGLKN